MIHEVCDESDSLDGFSQTHLIGQDPIQVVVVKRNQPLQTFNLKVKKKRRGLFITALKSERLCFL